MPSMSLTCCICNKPMQRSKTSKPQGQAAHHKCRRELNGGHGRTGYRHGCRCEVCTEAVRTAMADYAAQAAARDGITPSGRTRRQARGIDPNATLDCFMCDLPLENIRTNVARYPLHKACRQVAPEWMRKGWDDPTEARAARLAARQAKAQARAEAKVLARQDPRSDLRAGYEDGDYAKFLKALQDKVTITEGGCWVWQGRLKKRKAAGQGYPEMSVGGKLMQVHRMVIEAREGKPLGVLAAHHMCANSTCVNPDHLQPVTHRENMAEMLARNSLEARIMELEFALAEINPEHPALNRVGHSLAA